MEIVQPASSAGFFFNPPPRHADVGEGGLVDHAKITARVAPKCAGFFRGAEFRGSRDKENTAQPAPTHTVQQQQKPQQQQQNQQQQNLQQQQQDHPQQDNKKQQQQQAPADSAADRAKSATDGERDGFTIVQLRKRRGPSEPSGRDMVDLAATHGLDSGLLFLDQEKAFERVSHDYLYASESGQRPGGHSPAEMGASSGVSKAAGLRSTLAGEKLLREAVRTLQKLGLKLEMPDDSSGRSFPQITCPAPPPPIARTGESS
ncbi:unnamed protein product [Lampetra fluviatilis]